MSYFILMGRRIPKQAITGFKFQNETDNILYTRLTNGILLPKLANVAALIKDCRYATARGYARRAAQSTTVMFLQPVIYFGRAFPNWRARVIPAILISGFLAFVSKNPICFSDGSVSS